MSSNYNPFLSQCWLKTRPLGQGSVPWENPICCGSYNSMPYSIDRAAGLAVSAPVTHGGDPQDRASCL